MILFMLVIVNQNYSFMKPFPPKYPPYLPAPIQPTNLTTVSNEGIY